MSTLLKFLRERDYDNDDTRFTVVLPWREWRNTKNDLAELSALRESVATLTAQNAEQARQIEMARKVIQESFDGMSFFVGADCPLCGGEGTWTTDDNNPRMIPVQHKTTCPIFFAVEWLAATAPAPQDARP